MSQQPLNPIKVTAQAGDRENWETARTRHLANHPPKREGKQTSLKRHLTTTEGEPGVTSPHKPYLYSV